MSSSGGAASGGNGGSPAVSTTVRVEAVEEAVTGTHVVKVDGYSLSKELGNGKHITSETFDVGGHLWCIKYYPGGEQPEAADSISFYLSCLDQADALDVQAIFESTLIQNGKIGYNSTPMCSKVCTFTKDNRHWGFRMFVIQRKNFEQYLKDDCFGIRCDVTVIKKIPKFVTMLPSDIHRHLGQLLTSEEAVDVTFEVDGDTISAHRLVLAARSPVFKAQLLGLMKERTMSHIQIDDIEPRVFRAMLHFIYTDSLPEMDKDDTMVMAQHLMVAADRYGLERLKLVCEDMLCSCISSTMAATTLVLAEQHGWNGLKEACFQFLEKPSNFKAVLGTDGFRHLSTSCPSVLQELLAKVVP